MADTVATLLQLAQLAFASLVVLVIAGILYKEGVRGLLRRLIVTLRLIPGVDAAISAVLRREVSNFVRQMDATPAGARKSKVEDSRVIHIPMKGVCVCACVITWAIPYSLCRPLPL